MTFCRIRRHNAGLARELKEYPFTEGNIGAHEEGAKR